MLVDTIAQRITDLTKEKGVTIYSLAMSSGIDKSIIYDIINGRTKSPEVATIKKICDGFEPNVTLGDFFSTPEFDNLEQACRMIYDSNSNIGFDSKSLPCRYQGKAFFTVFH